MTTSIVGGAPAVAGDEAPDQSERVIRVPEAGAEAKEVAPRATNPVSVTRPRRVRSQAGRALWILGAVAVLFALFEVWVTPLSEARAQRALLATFQSQAVTSSTSGQLPYVPPGQPVGIVQVPAIGLNAVVVEGVTPENLKAGPGHLPGSPLPGQAGNVVIAGRRTTYGAPFRHLDRLSRGSDVYATTLQGRFRYVVSDVFQVRSGQRDVLAPSSDARLTLVTSDPAYIPDGRLVAVADLQGGALLPSLNQPASLFSGDAALGGDGAALAPTLLWAEVVAVCLAATLWLYRSRSVRRVAVYVMTTPVLLAALFMLFATLDRLLPATL